MFITKTLTDFRNTVETGVDPRLYSLPPSRIPVMALFLDWLKRDSSCQASGLIANKWIVQKMWMIDTGVI